MILRDIDSNWCEALCTRYPDSIDRKFLLEHVLGVDLRLIPMSLYQASHDPYRPLKEPVGGMDVLTRIGLMSANLQTIDHIGKLVLHETQTQTEPTTAGRPTRLVVEPTLRATDLGLGCLSEEMKSALAESDRTSFAFVDRQLDNLLQEHLLMVSAQLDSQTNTTRGFHVNWWRAPYYGTKEFYRHGASRHDELKKTKDGWIKSNAFVSCCQLASNLCK